MKLLNIASKVVKGNFKDLIASNNEIERRDSPISKAIKIKKEQLPQFDYLFVVKMPDLTINPDGSYSDDIEYFDMDIEINHRVFTMTAPNYTYDTVKTQTKNTYWYSASNRDIGQISITMDEFEDGLSMRYLKEWFRLIENDDGTYNVPSYYKRDIQLIRYSGTKNELSVLTYKGCFPTSISESTYSYEGSGILQYNVTFACDTVSFNVSDNVRAAIQEAQESIKNELPASKSGSGLNISSAINILGRVADVIF
jgi:hypothetical protein